MYKIIGTDGKEYGPVSADTVREWVAQGRADARTRVLVEGATEWKTLGELPEFLVGQPGPSPAVPPQPFPTSTSVTEKRTNVLATTGLVLAIFSITLGLCCCYGFPFNIAGLICSVIALTQINRDPLGQQGKGLALAGIVISVVSLLLAVLLIILVGSMRAMPDLLHRIQRL